MKDVARLAGVSVATVSAVINGAPVVSPARAERVRSAMRALDYRPDAVARSLKTGRTQVIGVVVPDLTNPFFPEQIRGIEEAATAQRYSVIVCNTNENPAQEQRQLDGLLSRRVDGVLISCSRRTSAYDAVFRQELPVVFLDQVPHETTAALVAADSFLGGLSATRHLIELGHLRIAVLARSLGLLAHADRVEGYRRAMQEAGLPVREEYYRVGGLDERDGYRFGMELLDLPQPPTAVFCCNNKMLAGFLMAVAERNVACPEQISVVGFDDHIWIQAYRPAITTVTQRSYDIGHLAMAKMFECLNGQRQQSERILLPCDLVVRKSTAPPRAQGRARC